MCECAQEHIKTLWQHRITGNAIKAVVCVCAPFIAAALRPKRVCTLRGLPPCVLPSAVNSGMIRHWYTVRQVNRDQFGPATRIKCQRTRDGVWGCVTGAVCTMKLCVSMCASSLWVFDPHYRTYGLLSECNIPRHTLCSRNQNKKKKNPLHKPPCGPLGLLTSDSSDPSPRGDYWDIYSFSSPWQPPVFFQTVHV